MKTDLAMALHNLATLYQQQGDFRKAIPHYEEALAIKRETYFFDDDPMIVHSLSELAWVNRSIGNYERAKGLLEEALAKIHSSYSRPQMPISQMLEEGTIVPLPTQADERPEVARILNDLAIANYESGDYATAVKLMRQALELDRAACGEQSTEVARDLDHMGWVFHGMGNFTQAETCYEQALAIVQERYGDNSETTSTILNRTGRAVSLPR